MFRFLLILILTYFIFKGIKMLVTYFISGPKNNSNINKNTRNDSKYKDVEEVEFTEIKTETKNGKE